MTFSQFIYGGSSFSLLISQKNRIIYDFCVEIWWDIIQLKRDVSGGMRWKNCHAKHFYDNKMRALNKTKNNYKTSMSCTLNCIPTCCCGYSSVENPHTQKKLMNSSRFFMTNRRDSWLCVSLSILYFFIELNSLILRFDDARQNALSLSLDVDMPSKNYKNYFCCRWKGNA